MGRRVLVTGVAGTLGGLVAAELARVPGVDRVIGVDSSTPTVPPGDGVEVLSLDVRNASVVTAVRGLGVDTVVHMGVITTPVEAGGRASMKEINVIGTMHLLAACQKLPTLDRLIVRSSAGVYGSGPADPAMFTEVTEPTRPPRSGWGRDCIDVEASVRGFARRRRDVATSTLRFAHAIGPTLRTGFTDLFLLPAVPAPLGRDARLQFVHTDDIVAAVVRAATIGCPATGQINVAGPGCITVMQAARMAGRLVLGLPAAALRRLHRFPGAARGMDLTDDDIALLSFGRVLDTSRMTTVLGLRPAYSTAQAFADFVAARQLSSPMSRVLSAVRPT